MDLCLKTEQKISIYVQELLLNFCCLSEYFPLSLLDFHN